MQQKYPILLIPESLPPTWQSWMITPSFIPSSSGGRITTKWKDKLHKREPRLNAGKMKIRNSHGNEIMPRPFEMLHKQGTGKIYEDLEDCGLGGLSVKSVDIKSEMNGERK